MIRSQLPKPCKKAMRPHQEIPAVAPQADLPTEAPENVITSPIPSRTLKNPPDLQDRNFRIPQVQPAATEYTLTPPPLIQTSTALFSMGTPTIPRPGPSPTSPMSCFLQVYCSINPVAVIIMFSYSKWASCQINEAVVYITNTVLNDEHVFHTMSHPSRL